jgi:hypothetical protein
MKIILILIILTCIGNSSELFAQPYPSVNADVQKYPYVKYPFKLEVIAESPKPVIDNMHPDCATNKSGFEGGFVVKQNGTYYMFVGEMTGIPHRAKMQIALWTSSDALNWKRQKTIIEGAEARTPTNNQSEVWMQQLIFDEKENRWNLFYIAYRAGDATKGEVPDIDHNGIVGRLRSKIVGRAGIDGDYEKVDIVFQPDNNQMDWEGQQGTDSFFTYQVGKKWYGIYGSRNHVTPSPWLVGLAVASTLQGPYKRIKTHSPLWIERYFIENPMVEKIKGLGFVCVYDQGGYTYPYYPFKDNNSIGYSFSANGIDWKNGKPLKVQSDGENNWASDVRTPFGLVAEANGEYTVLYSAKEKTKQFWSIGRVKVKLIVEP